MFRSRNIYVRFKIDFYLPAGYFFHLENLWSVEHLLP